MRYSIEKVMIFWSEFLNNERKYHSKKEDRFLNNAAKICRMGEIGSHDGNSTKKNIFLTNTFSRFRQRYNFPLQIKSIVKYIWLVANAQRIYYINNYLSFPLYTLTNTMNVFVL